MNRVINDPNRVVEDMLLGWMAAHADSLRQTPHNPRVVARRAAPERGKVGIVTGGGSGHEPAFLGYVGDGLVDAVAIGEIFSSPTAKSFADAMRAADGGAGVACLYGNYAGDNMNVRLAIEQVAAEGLVVRTVVANDDVPSAPKGDEAKRRGVAGEILMWKVGAAKADTGADLDAVIATAQKAIDHTRSVGIGLSACVIPAVGHANFTIADGTMEMGIGHHGEPGVSVQPTASADQMAELMLAQILPDLPFVAGHRVAVLISGLGATPVMEQYILFHAVRTRLEGQGITVAVNFVGNLFTSLEMLGVTLTVMRLDDELETLLKAPCHAVGLSVPGQRAAKVFAGHAPVAAAASPVVAVAAEGEEGAVAPRTVVGPALAINRLGGLVRELITAVVGAREHLSEVDGLIGDGDHGINMAKGFLGCGERLDRLGAGADALPAALLQLSEALMDDIGGSMGPLYGRFFAAMARTLAPHPQLDAALFGEALAAAVAAVQAMGNAQVGDKTLIDTLVPARDAFVAAQGQGFAAALDALVAAAERGRDSTVALQARIGRSARLGPRSIGVMDAGAASSCLMLTALARGLQHRL